MILIFLLGIDWMVVVCNWSISCDWQVDPEKRRDSAARGRETYYD